MDHGYLNLPLAKRGDIDRQLDAYKREQAAIAKATQKAKSVEFRELKVKAKAALSELAADASLMADKSSMLGITAVRLVKELDSMAKWEPAKMLKIRDEWLRCE